MSTAEILSLISTVSFVIAAISFALTVFFWVFFKIPSVIGDLSGRTAKKSIAKTRSANEKAGGQGYKPSAVNSRRGKLTDTMQHSGKLPTNPKTKKAMPDSKKAANESVISGTGLLAANKAGQITGEETELLRSTNSTNLPVDENAAASLYEAVPPSAKRTSGKKLTVLDEVMLIHTEEVI